MKVRVLRPLVLHLRKYGVNNKPLFHLLSDNKNTILRPKILDCALSVGRCAFHFPPKRQASVPGAGIKVLMHMRLCMIDIGTAKKKITVETPVKFGPCEMCQKARPLPAKNVCNPCYLKAWWESRPQRMCIRCRKLRPINKDGRCRTCYHDLLRFRKTGRSRKVQSRIWDKKPKAYRHSQHASYLWSLICRWKGVPPLTDTERYILYARSQGETLQHIARAYQCTRERIRQIEEQSLQKIVFLHRKT